MTKEEKYELLCKLVTSVTGSIKLKETGMFLNCLKMRLNPNFGVPEVSVCLQDLQAAIEQGAYKWEDRNGKTWIPIKLQVWGKDTNTERKSEHDELKRNGFQPPPVDLNDDLPF